MGPQWLCDLCRESVIHEQPPQPGHRHTPKPSLPLLCSLTHLAAGQSPNPWQLPLIWEGWAGAEQNMQILKPQVSGFVGNKSFKAELFYYFRCLCHQITVKWHCLMSALRQNGENPPASRVTHCAQAGYYLSKIHPGHGHVFLVSPWFPLQMLCSLCSRLWDFQLY